MKILSYNITAVVLCLCLLTGECKEDNGSCLSGTCKKTANDIIGTWKLMKQEVVSDNNHIIDCSSSFIFYDFQKEGRLTIYSEFNEETDHQTESLHYEICSCELNEKCTILINSSSGYCKLSGDSLQIDNTVREGHIYYLYRVSQLEKKIKQHSGEPAN